MTDPLRSPELNAESEAPSGSGNAVHRRIPARLRMVIAVGAVAAAGLGAALALPSVSDAAAGADMCLAPPASATPAKPAPRSQAACCAARGDVRVCNRPAARCGCGGGATARTNKRSRCGRSAAGSHCTARPRATCEPSPGPARRDAGISI